ELEFVQIIIIIVVMTVMVVVIICLLNHYRLSAWAFLTRHSQARQREEGMQPRARHARLDCSSQNERERVIKRYEEGDVWATERRALQPTFIYAKGPIQPLPADRYHSRVQSGQVKACPAHESCLVRRAEGACARYKGPLVPCSLQSVRWSEQAYWTCLQVRFIPFARAAPTGPFCGRVTSELERLGSDGGGARPAAASNQTLAKSGLELARGGAAPT
ncbi:hypothetical protein cypCar_00042875, partial [Cyprinus carpio]